MKYFKLFCITLLLLLLASCQNFFSGSDVSSSSSKSAKGYVSFTGNICLEGAYPKEFVSGAASASASARTAFPQLPAGAVYRVTATNGTLTYDSKDGNTDIQIAADNSYFTIRQLATGATWTITVGLYNSTDTGFTSPLMSDSYPFTPSEESNVLTHDFVLTAALTGGKGRVLLTLNYPTGAFDEFSYSCLSSNSDKWTCLVDRQSNCVILSNENNTYPIEAGSYVLQLDFKKSGMLLYSDIQTINIFKNLETSQWVNNGGSEAIQSGGTYEISQAMIDAFAQTQIFVGTNSWGTASSTGTGSRFAPFNTLQKAISYIETTGSSTKDYTIWISGSSDENGGSIQGNTTLGDSLDGKAKSITIRGMHLDSQGNPLDKLIGYATKLNGIKDYKNIDLSIFETGEFAPVLTILSTEESSLVITLQDICINEGAARNGAGLRTGGNHVTVTLNNVIISTNHASLYGGGVEVSSGAIVTFNSGKIKENSAYKSDSNSHGAGVSLNHAGSFIMNGGEISYNHAFESGGGVSLRSAGETPTSNSFAFNSGKIISNYADAVVSGNKCGFAGAVHVYDGTFTMAGGEISENHTNSDAGAISISGISGKPDTSAKFIMSGGIIKENYVESPSTPNTSAIELSTVGTLQLSGNAYIPRTDSKHIIYLASGKKITIGGTLSPTSDGTTTGTAESVAAVIDIADTYAETREILTGNQANVNSASGKVRMKNDAWCVNKGKLFNGRISSAAELKDTLTSMTANTAATPYNIVISDESPDFNVLKEALYVGDKYVNVSFSNATFTNMSNLGTYTYYNEENNTNYVYGLKIVNLTIPASVTSGSFASSNGFSVLQNYYVESGNTKYKSTDGILYTADDKTLIAYPKAKPLEGAEGAKTFTIPNTVEIIGASAFSKNNNLNVINIPSSVKTISDSAFCECIGLTSVTFNEGLERIETSAFTAVRIENINVPESVTYIHEQAFALMAYTTLKEITVATGNETYYSYDGALYKPGANNYLSLIYCPPKKTTWKIKDNITTKGGNAFYYNSEYNSTLTKIVFEEGVTSIKINFKGLVKVTDIYLPSTVTEIGSDLFYTRVKDVYYAGTEADRNNNTQLKNCLKSTGITWHYSTSYTGD